MRIPSGTVDQPIYFVALDETDGETLLTGLSSFTAYRSRNGGAFTAYTTPTITEIGSGVYTLLLDEDMTISSGDDSQEFIVRIEHVGMRTALRSFELYRMPANFSSLVIDANGRMQVQSGTSAGQINLASGTVTIGAITSGALETLGDGVIGRFDDNTLPAEPTAGSYAESIKLGGEAKAAAEAAAEAAEGIVAGTTQPRVNKPAAPAYRLKISSMADGTYKCTKPIRLRPGVLAGDGIPVGIDMSPQFGQTYVETVGTPTVSGGSLTCDDLGPRDTDAMVIIDGTATASESRTVTVPVTMETGETVSVTFDVRVFAE